MNATTSPTTARRSRRAITEITDQLDPAAVAAADQLIADGEAASMAPLDMLPNEVEVYNEAIAIAAPFLAVPVSFAAAICDGPRKLGVDTIAAKVKAATGCSDAYAIEDTCARFASWLNDGKKHGDRKVFEHRRANLVATANHDDPTAPRLYLVELPTGTGLVKMLTEDGKKPYAIIAVIGGNTWMKTDQQTGEIRTGVSLGNFKPVHDLAGRCGIVKMLTTDQAEGVELDWDWDQDVRNLAWALSKLRRFSADAEYRNAKTQAEADEESVGWGAPIAPDMPF